MHGQLQWSDSWKLCKKMSEIYSKYCRISFGFCIYPYCCFSWALSIFFPHRLHVACSFVISSWDSVCSRAISKNLVGSSEISERQSIYPSPTSCFLPWSSCMDFLLTSQLWWLHINTELKTKSHYISLLNLEFKWWKSFHNLLSRHQYIHFTAIG